MRIIATLLLGFTLALILNCSRKSTDAGESEDNSLSGEVIISDIRPELTQRDHFSLRDVRIRGRIIDVSLTYSGGCEDHGFRLHMNRGFAKSNPVQADIYVEHSSNDDFCRMMVNQTVSFDLGPVVNLYHQMSGKTDRIIINVHDYFEGQPGDKLSATFVP